ncbi:MAG: DUF4389 domain-containing protein [Micropepsaceae bacterium]
MPQPDAAVEPPAPTQDVQVRTFPWDRLFLSIFYGAIAWFAFWGLLFLAVIMWILIAVSREPHVEFKRFLSVGAKYVGQCLAYVLTISSEKPFPLGPLPTADS